MKKRVVVALVLMGFTSLVAQSLLIREFLVTFYGNELTIGLIFAIWIAAEALGSTAASRLGQTARSPFLFYGLLQALIALYLPMSIFLIRNAKNFLPLVTGESPGIVPIIASCIAIVGPLSFIDGMQFPLGCRIYNGTKKDAGETAGAVYALEAAGFILAGPVFTYVLLTNLHSFQIVLLVGLFNLANALSLVRAQAPSGAKRYAGIVIGALLSANLVLLFPHLSAKIHMASIARQWRGQDLIGYKNSPYGNLAVVRRNEQYTFYSDGIPIINIPTPNIVETEEFVHFGLLAHPDPKNVLFLGGGAGGLIAEALKHPVETIDYAELDPLLIKLVREFPKEITKKELGDPRVHLHITDGVLFVKTTPSRYDAVFVHLPLPSTLALNRYYTEEFLERIKEILRPGGCVVLSLPGSLSYLNTQLQQLNLCVVKTLREAFGYISVIPGDTNLYVAATAPLEITPEIFQQRAAQRSVTAASLDRFHLEDRLKQSWQDWFFQTLAKTPPVRVNTNLEPAGLFYGLSYWSSLFNPGTRGFFRELGDLRSTYLLAYSIIMAAFLFLLKMRLRLGRRFAVAASITTTGFIGMSLSLIFILSYQIFFGYMYNQIALLVASFMGGLAAGGWLITKGLGTMKRGLAWFISMETAMGLFCLVSGALLVRLNTMQGCEYTFLFYIASALAGFLVGAEFPLANRLFLEKNAHVRTAGILYALDLVGAFFAALLVPVIAIPVLGMFTTCLVLAALKSAGLLLFIPSRRR